MTATRLPDGRRLAGLQLLDERQRLPDAVEVVALVGDVDVGAHPDGEHDRVDLRLELRAAAPRRRASPSRNSTPRSASSRASSGSGSFDWRYGAIA